MSVHRQEDYRPPSRWHVALTMIAASGTAAVVLRVSAEDGWTYVHVAAVVFGLCALFVLMTAIVAMIRQRADARIALIRRKARVERDSGERGARTAL